MHKKAFLVVFVGASKSSFADMEHTHTFDQELNMVSSGFYQNVLQYVEASTHDI